MPASRASQRLMRTYTPIQPREPHPMQRYGMHVEVRFREQQANLWSFVAPGAVLCITTNGTVNKQGDAVMGRGCAQQAAERYPYMPKRLAAALEQYGNRTFRFAMPGDWTLVTLPVKHDWFARADPRLVTRSIWQLVEMADEHGWTDVVLVRPGTGSGKRTWAEIQPILTDALDDRFTVVWQ